MLFNLTVSQVVTSAKALLNNVAEQKKGFGQFKGDLSNLKMSDLETLNRFYIQSKDDSQAYVYPINRWWIGCTSDDPLDCFDTDEVYLNEILDEDQRYDLSLIMDALHILFNQGGNSATHQVFEAQPIPIPTGWDQDEEF